MSRKLGTKLLFLKVVDAPGNCQIIYFFAVRRVLRDLKSALGSLRLH
jgi:hypothetical protein